MFFDSYSYWCKQKGVSPNKAAKEIGISEASPSHWKKDGRTPRAETLQKLADYFGITVNELIDHSTATEKTDTGVPSPVVSGVTVGRTFGDPQIPTETKKVVVYASDNSMIFDCIPKGAEVSIIPTNEIDENEIVAVIFQGNTLIRRFNRVGDTIILSSSNPKYLPVVTNIEELKKNGDGILGTCDKVTFHL